MPCICIMSRSIVEACTAAWLHRPKFFLFEQSIRLTQSMERAAQLLPLIRRDKCNGEPHVRNLLAITRAVSRVRDFISSRMSRTFIDLLASSALRDRSRLDSPMEGKDSTTSTTHSNAYATESCRNRALHLQRHLDAPGTARPLIQDATLSAPGKERRITSCSGDPEPAER